MLFAAPVSFREALESRKVKALLPTTGSARDLARLAPEIRERATFSARTASAQHLAAIDETIGKMLAPEALGPGESVNPARAREILRQSLAAIGYEPDPAERGGLKDLGSTKRLNLIVDMNTGLARGYGWWEQGQDAAILDEWPAQELVRLEERRARRNWLERWRAAGGRVFPGTGLDGRAGRLVALKNDPVWTNLSEFGLPYPPFAYGSGVGVEDVGRETAVALGLIDEQTQIAPQSRGFNAELEAELPPLDRQSALFKAILQSMGDAVEIAGDVLRFKQAA